MTANALSVADIPVRQDSEGRYCLNDLHQAAGHAQRHRPRYWLANRQTQALVAEMAIGGIPPIAAKQRLGTFVCRELVYAYAMWISPAFHLKVIRAYDAWVRQTASPSPDPLAQLDDPAALRGLLLTYATRRLALEQAVADAQPKLAALDRLATADGTLCLTDAAKALQLQPKRLIEWLLAHRWLYRRPGANTYVAHQTKIQAGLVTMKLHLIVGRTGSRLVEQVRLTAKGLTRLSLAIPDEAPTRRRPTASTTPGHV
jgi:phage antirepressor YoqD-like protein